MHYLPPLSPADLQRIEPWLPFGLALPDNADPVARVQGEFKRMVLGQRLHPGQKVPLDAIAGSLGVSRTPVREGLRLLEMESLVTALPNRGFVVREIGAEDAEQLYAARACIEAFLLPQALQNLDDRFVREVGQLNDTYRRSLGDSASRRRLGMLADKAFHMRIASQSGNAVLLDMLANVFDRLTFTRPLEGFPPARMGDAVREHEAIVDALRSASAAGRGAGRVTSALMANVRNGGDAVVRYMRERERLMMAI